MCFANQILNYVIYYYYICLKSINKNNCFVKKKSLKQFVIII